MGKQLLPDKLIALRGKRKRSEVAKALGISVSALQMYEKWSADPQGSYQGKTGSILWGFH